MLLLIICYSQRPLIVFSYILLLLLFLYNEIVKWHSSTLTRPCGKFVYFCCCFSFLFFFFLLWFSRNFIRFYFIVSLAREARDRITEMPKLIRSSFKVIIAFVRFFSSSPPLEVLGAESGVSGQVSSHLVWVRRASRNSYTIDKERMWNYFYFLESSNELCTVGERSGRVLGTFPWDETLKW